MKRVLFFAFLLMLGSLAEAAGFPSSTAAKQFRPAADPARGPGKGHHKPKVNPYSPNIIPIITLNNNHIKNGVPRHEPCAATRLTPTLLLTAAHCIVGGLKNGSRVEATFFEAEDGIRGLALAKPKNDRGLIKPNAQVFVYRPQYTRPERIPISSDFAVVVLEPGLKMNPLSSQYALTKLFEGMSPSLREKIKSPIAERIQQEFNTQAAEYAKFINKPLDEVALLTMIPGGGIVPELRGRQLKAYFWNGYEREKTRDSLIILNERINEPEGTSSRDSRVLLFKGEEFLPGTSGSPVFDPKKKLVVSLAIGIANGGYNAGGLIDPNVCRWVKSHDKNVKCLVRNEVPDEQPNH